nr:hypothetical protein [Elizabethkingia sp. ASV34]
MASKQLNFFITAEEHNRINNMILEKGIVVLLNQNINSITDFKILNQLPPANHNIFQVYLSTPIFLDQIIIDSADAQTHYFNIDESYLLEFNLGGFYSDDDSFLKRARFYYVKSFYNKYDQLENKSNSFCEWCDDTIRNFKKEFLKRYSKEKEFFYSQSAIDWIEKNNAVETGGGLGWKKS